MRERRRGHRTDKPSSYARIGDLERLRALIDEGDFSDSPVQFDFEAYLAAKLDIGAFDRCPTLQDLVQVR